MKFGLTGTMSAAIILGLSTAGLSGDSKPPSLRRRGLQRQHHATTWLKNPWQL